MNDTYRNKQISDYRKQENEREERLHDRFIKLAMDRLRRALTIEYFKKEISAAIKKRLIMSPLEFLGKSYIKLSLADLYRRYRHVRIQSLSEALAIAGTSETREETMEKIREMIKEVGEAHQESKKREKEACAVS